MNKRDLRGYLGGGDEEIKECFNYDRYLKNIDKIFERVFKEENNEKSV